MSPEAKYNDRLKDYVEVKDRIRQFYEKHPDGRLVTAAVSASSDPDGKPRIWVEAAAYRTPDDPLPGRGWSWMEIPGTTPYTRGSELENTETSAWGRAIGALGIGIERSIASAQEVRNKDGGNAPAEPRFDPGAANGSGLIGFAEVGKADADFELRLTPTGHRLAFRLSERAGGRIGIKVEVLDTLAQLVAEYRADIENQRVTAWGTVRDEKWTPKNAKAPVTYQVLTLTRLKVGALRLTEPEPDEDPDAAEDFDAGWLPVAEAVPA